MTLCLALLGLLLPAAFPSAVACGPFFPNMLLLNADEAVRVAPEASFRKELQRMKLVASPLQAKPGNDPADTTAAELADLKAALDLAGVAASQRDAILEVHGAERLKIRVFAAESHQANELRPDSNTIFQVRAQNLTPTPGLPAEFVDYFRGSIAWHQDKMEDARAAWLKLLARPPRERHFKSTWAAFMLGKSWEEDNRSKAIHWFQEVRHLATNGFADSLGLAASSLGWEARLHWREGRYAQAVELYLQQAATGDLTAVGSLQFTAERALALGDEALRPLAKHPQAQRVLTAYVISGGFRDPPIDIDGAVKDQVLRLLEKAAAKLPQTTALGLAPATWHHFQTPAKLWLEAVERAEVKDIVAAERLALAAYQTGDFAAANRWLTRAGESALGHWLRAKVALRAGQLETANQLLARLTQEYPLDSITTTGDLFVRQDAFENLPAPRQLLGELGVLRLARGEYGAALDALLRSGFWIDAAYVAERVLTLEELQAYVDRQWPDAAPKSAAPTHWQTPGPLVTAAEDKIGLSWRGGPTDPRALIRYLLARRLARARQWSQARAYYPPPWLAKYDTFCAALKLAEDTSQASGARAAAYFQAARLARHDGLELFGTETEPDWRWHDGDYTDGPSLATRLATTNLVRLAATAEEQRRATQHKPEPDKRFHYRYVAADLAWQAALLMPNNSDDTARVLCEGGSWLKVLDPKAADVFYKALVRRCRKTALGAEADRLRWFPSLEPKQTTPAPTNQPPSPKAEPVTR